MTTVLHGFARRSRKWPRELHRRNLKKSKNLEFFRHQMQVDQRCYAPPGGVPPRGVYPPGGVYPPWGVPPWGVPPWGSTPLGVLGDPPGRMRRGVGYYSRGGEGGPGGNNRGYFWAKKKWRLMGDSRGRPVWALEGGRRTSKALERTQT